MNIFKHASLIKYSKNSLWSLSDNVVRMLIGLIVSAYVIRYLGPKYFGMLSYVLCIINILAPVAGLGIDFILFRNLSMNLEEREGLIGSAIILRLLAGLLLAFIASVTIFFSSESNLFKVLFYVCAFGLIFNSFTVIRQYFNALVKARYIAIANTLAFLIVSGSRLFLVSQKFGLIWFALMFPLQKLLLVVLLVVFYFKENNGKAAFKFNRAESMNLLKDSWPLIFSSFVTLLYMSMDQLFIKWYLGLEHVGYYATGVKFVILLYAIPSIFTNTVYPSIVKSFQSDQQEFYRKTQTVYYICFAFSLLMLIFFILFGKVLIFKFFGKEFAPSVIVLMVYSCSLPFAFMGSLSNKILILKNLQRVILKRNLLGLFVNFIFNLLLIPIWGIAGAALSVVIAQICILISYSFNYETKEIFYMQIKTLFFPLGYLTKKSIWGRKC